MDRVGGGLGWDWVGRGRRGGWDGLLNFHFNFQKTWAEPGNPSKFLNKRYFAFVNQINIDKHLLFMLYIFNVDRET